MIVLIDMHYDLLSVLYNCYLRDDFSYVLEFAKNYNENNVSGLLANLYFMNEAEMKNELGNDYGEIDAVEMFRISTELFRKYFPSTKVVFSIEGCDYIKSTDELEKLYDLGLRNILLVWNNPNKYGSGTRSNKGLSDEGRKFIIKAIDLGICIDLSHMNKNTFYDTIELLREQKKLGKKFKVIASHSNCFSLCSNVRNLSDEQILMLKEFDPIIGIVFYWRFISSDSNADFKEKYLEHICHVVNLIGISNVGVATDDMGFASSLFGEAKEIEVFNYSNICDDMYRLLKSKFIHEDVEKILYKNIERKLFEEEVK